MFYYNGTRDLVIYTYNDGNLINIICLYGMAVYGELIMTLYRQIVDILMVGIVPKV